MKTEMTDSRISSDAKKSEDLVRQYAFGLSEMSLPHIVHLLHPDFKFTYHVNHGMGYGITTDVRYIGHLYKTFSVMKPLGLKINTDFCHLEIKGVMFLGIKLLPPHDRRIIFPMDYQLNETVRNSVPDSEMYLIPRVKNGLLCKVECYSFNELSKFGIKLKMDYNTSFQELAKLAAEQIAKQEPATFEKAKEQAERHRKEGEKRFAKEAPEIQEQLKEIKIPLSFTDTVNIYRWLCRKQITINMISKEVLKEFKTTEQYEAFIRRINEKD